MNYSKAPLRIKGLVRLMNRLREEAQVGVPPEQLPQLREAVAQSLNTVETACQRHGITPADLPTPSRRAYEYLKGLDLDAFPLRRVAPPRPATPPAPPQQRIYVTGVIATCDYYHARFARDIAQAPKQCWTAATARDLAQEIAADAQDIERICAEADGTPGQLPPRSLQGYQWLTFLSDPQYLALHLNTLARLQQSASTRAAAGKPLHLSLYAIPHLYRIQRDVDATTMIIHEGFIGAPKSILRDLIRIARTPKARTPQAQLKRYAEGAAFEELMLALATTTATLHDQPQGHYHNLAPIFARVNAAHFQSQIERPQLHWTPTPTRRKMAHYHRYYDAVAFSVTLDTPEVPDYVLDFLMYHELLHKHLGTQISAGRRRMHTPEFRTLERQFPHYAEARAFLNDYLRELTP